ncbi:MAG: NADH-quinone oxidoreductase subunit C [Alphaproteobacteria bacterium CG_4_10_14_0_2_um_filter_63_37]|nr:MAG: hypothetical protein AUJ55_00355 [Proteobacteria bacterium CG1_02_64_396]PJA24030.1 MAG: NADH-quinone oxidoreductase subunit C [Alphaproteobacteria bacterium CG_4_10_14_0_2_um_filter_63_37]
MADYQALAKVIKNRFGDAVTVSIHRGDELNVEVSKEQWEPLARFLRDDPSCRFEILTDLCGVDFPQREQRFEVVVHLLSISLNQRIRFKTKAGEWDPVSTLVETWNNANWFEREAFDLFGILFEGHPDLRRLLTDYGFEGHPLRKDFPLSGEVECHWDEQQLRMVYTPVQIKPRELRFQDYQD